MAVSVKNGLTVNSSNEILRFVFRELHDTIVNSVNARTAIDRLFAHHVLSVDDLEQLTGNGASSRYDQCRQLLVLLQRSGHSGAFVELKAAICEEPAYDWLVDDINRRCQIRDERVACNDYVPCFRGNQRAIVGITVLQDLLYVAISRSSELEVYDITQHSTAPLRRLVISGLTDAKDMTSCNRHGYIYISDKRRLVHRVKDGGNGSDSHRWLVGDAPLSLAVNDVANVLVTCCKASKIKEYTHTGTEVREIVLESVTPGPLHAIQLTVNDELLYAVCHGHKDEPLHRVCLVDSSGQLRQVYGSSKGAEWGHLHAPFRLASLPGRVDGLPTILVADSRNARVLSLNGTSLARNVREVVGDLEGCPTRMSVDGNSGRLYLAVNTWSANQWINGTVYTYTVATLNETTS